ncbi:MAG: hypothetical protein IPI35_23110 [Deltaproteobacteria bacterium]|nr:hypothetical protein [Deltaproteobacteria bacterium]
MGPILLLLLSCAARDGAVRGGAPADPAQLASFELAWSAIGEAYPDPAMKGLDWQGLHDELLPEAQAARTNAETRAVIQKLLDALGDSHFQVFPAAEDVPREITLPTPPPAPPPPPAAPAQPPEPPPRRPPDRRRAPTTPRPPAASPVGRPRRRGL